MRFHLYEVSIQRQDHTAHAFIVAPSKDAAWLYVIEHEEALGLTHLDLTIERIDDRIDDDKRTGLDDLLTAAPVGFASFADRWIAHTAPVQQLKLFSTDDDKGGKIFAIAPNVDVAAAVFTTKLKIPRNGKRLLYISDGQVDLAHEMVCNLAQLLEFGPIGIAEFDTDEQRWFMW